MSTIAAHGTETARRSKPTRLWAGYALTAIPVLMLVFSASMKLSGSPQMMDVMGKLGYRSETLLGIALLEIACVLIFAIPRTAVLGAVLLTGYLGGAIATHVRVGDPFLAPLVVALLVWGGLYLREERLHALLPIRKD